MKASMSLTGCCACEGVRYALRSPPMFAHCCHCKDCQRQTGSAFVLNALIETDRIELFSGKPYPVAVPTDSGHPHDIYRCPACQAKIRCTASIERESISKIGFARLNAAGS